MRLSDNKFSNGGSSPHFTLSGKTWSSIGQLKNHLRLIRYTPEVYDNCRIVELSMTENDHEPFSLCEWVEQAKEDKVLAKLSGKVWT